MAGCNEGESKASKHYSSFIEHNPPYYIHASNYGSKHEGKRSSLPGLNSDLHKELFKLFSTENSSKEEDTPPSANMAGKLDQVGEWVIDSGCTEHVHNPQI